MIVLCAVIIQERLGVLVAARSMHSTIPLTAPAIRRRHTQKGIGPLLRIFVFPSPEEEGAIPFWVYCLNIGIRDSPLTAICLRGESFFFFELGDEKAL